MKYRHWDLNKFPFHKLLREAIKRLTAKLLQKCNTWYFVPEALSRPLLIIECQFSMLDPLK